MKALQTILIISRFILFGNDRYQTEEQEISQISSELDFEKTPSGRVEERLEGCWGEERWEGQFRGYGRSSGRPTTT